MDPHAFAQCDPLGFAAYARTVAAGPVTLDRLRAAVPETFARFERGEVSFVAVLQDHWTRGLLDPRAPWETPSDVLVERALHNKSPCSSGGSRSPSGSGL